MMKKDNLFYEVLKEELDIVLKAITEERDTLLAKTKPIDRPDTKYANRITSCIIYYSNKNRRYDDIDLATYYRVEENAQWEIDQILDVNYHINCRYGVDYALTKKIVCCMLGLSIDQYQMLLSSSFESSKVFRNIEEYLIAIRQEGAENFTRNAIAVETNLKTKGQFGGFNVEVKTPKEKTTVLKFDPSTASLEEIKQRLLEYDDIK